MHNDDDEDDGDDDNDDDDFKKPECMWKCKEAKMLCCRYRGCLFSSITQSHETFCA